MIQNRDVNSSINIHEVDPALIEDLVAASRFLASERVLDAFGHVSARHPGNANRYLMSCNLAPELVTALRHHGIRSRKVKRGRYQWALRFSGEIHPRSNLQSPSGRPCSRA